MQKMNIGKAIEILELHNKWRRDNDGKHEMAEPKELGRAIDTVVSEFKNLHLQNVANCNFKTVIALYEDVNSILATSEQILPMHKGDKLTISDKYYMVDYVDYDFDKAIFEIVVTDDN